MAQSVVKADYDKVYIKSFVVYNVSCSANGLVQIEFKIGDIPAGECATGILCWVDGTNTSGATGITSVFLSNIWGHQQQTGSNVSMWTVFSNVGANAAKFTAHLLVLYTPNRYRS